MSKKTLRPAIAMIELIFALVIMGIVLMSAPMLISTASKSAYVAIQQEGINEAASQVNMIIGYHWDKNDADEDFIPPILAVAAGDSELIESPPPTPGRRAGTPEESYRAFPRSDGQRFSASALGSTDAGDTVIDDIDDFDGDTTLIEIESAGSVDYIEDSTTIEINSKIRYISDSTTYNTGTMAFSPDFLGAGTTSAVSSTNIKRVTVTLTSANSAPDELDKKIILHAFSCNIGGYQLEEKDTD